MKISRKTALKSLSACIVSIPAFAATYSTKDQFLEDFTAAWKSSKEATLKIFNQMPEDKLDWKYTPESFSFRTQFVHCINFSVSQLTSRLKIKSPYEKNKGELWSKFNKEELATEIGKFYDWLLEVAKNTKPERLVEMEPYAGGEIPMWRLFYVIDNHIIHHRGQVICYLRLNDITPASYNGW